MRVPVTCTEEKKVVAELDVVDGKTSCLTPSFLAAYYIPMSREYELEGMPPNKRVLSCPRCSNPLSLAGKIKTNESKQSIKTDSAVIIVGRTKVRPE